MRAPPLSAGTQAVDRAAELVGRVVRADGPLAFTDLINDTGLAKSTTSRLLAALERTGCRARDAGGYVAGPLFALYAARHDPSTSSSGSPGRPCERLGEQTGETVNLAVPAATASSRSPRSTRRYLLGTRDWIQRRRARRTARRSARSSSPADVVAAARRAAGAAHADRTVTDRAALRRELAAIRASGYGDDASTSSRSASPPSPRPSSAATATSSPPSASRARPTGSATQLDELGPLLIEQAADAVGDLLRGTDDRRRARHDTRRDPQGAVRRDPGRQRARGPRADRRGPGARHGAADAALRRADPLAGGGRRPLRARRLLRARDADRRPRDGRRHGACCGRCWPRPASRPSASS